MKWFVGYGRRRKHNGSPYDTTSQLLKAANKPRGVMMDDEIKKPKENLDASLARQLQHIENEETPERLLTLARELQELLRGRT